MALAAAVAASCSIAGASCGSSTSSCSVLERCRSVLRLRRQQLQRPAALQVRPVAPAPAVAASCLGCRSVLWLRHQQLQRPAVLQGRPVALAAAVAVSCSVAGASCGSGSSGCSVLQRCKSVLWLQQQRLQRPAALQERPVAPAAAVAASCSVVGALQERCRGTLQRTGALQRCCRGRIGDERPKVSECSWWVHLWCVVGESVVGGG